MVMATSTAASTATTTPGARSRSWAVVSFIRAATTTTATTTIFIVLHVVATASDGVFVTHTIVRPFDGWWTVVASEQLPFVTESTRNEFTVSFRVNVAVECTVRRGYRRTIVTSRWNIIIVVVVSSARRYDDVDVIVVVGDDVITWSPTESDTIITLHIVIGTRYGCDGGDSGYCDWCPTVVGGTPS